MPAVSSGQAGRGSGAGARAGAAAVPPLHRGDELLPGRGAGGLFCPIMPYYSLLLITLSWQSLVYFPSLAWLPRHKSD